VTRFFKRKPKARRRAVPPAAPASSTPSPSARAPAARVDSTSATAPPPPTRAIARLTLAPRPTMSRIFSCLAGLKFGKLFGTVGTMLIAVGVYAIVFGWRYAVGIVAMLFVHEMGHYLAARQRGMNVGMPTFIPFVGAWIELKHGRTTPRPRPTSASPARCWAPWRDRRVLPRAQLRHELAAGGGVHRLLHQPDQHDPAAAAGRRPHHGGAVAAHLAAGRAHHRPAAVVPLQLILLLIAILAVPHVMAALNFDKNDPAGQRTTR
jgi:fatty acid desaturase